MDNNEKYDLLAEREKGLASYMGIVPNDKNYIFDEASIKKALTTCSYFKLLSFSHAKDNEADNQDLSFDAEVEYLDETFNIQIDVLKTEKINFNDYAFGNHIEDELLQIAGQQEYYLNTSMYFGSDALESFHLQLKIMNAIVPHACLAVDFMSYRLLSPDWLSMTAKSPTPPSPDYLYILHGVYNKNEEDGSAEYWLHTHGLHRCGSVELEILNIKSGENEMYGLVNATVKKFLSDPALEKERFAIGYDGMGINLCWLRWEEALKDLPENILGGSSDREGEGNVHAEPSGILFAVEDDNMVSPQIYSTTLSNNPIYYISNEETHRMSTLAKERFSIFAKNFEIHKPKTEKKSFIKSIFGSKKQENENPAWTFLVKLGLSTNSPQTDSEREHLWFELLNIDNEKIEGKLLNQPYWIDGLNEGDIKIYPTDLLTDWIIYAPNDTFTPDSAYRII